MPDIDILNEYSQAVFTFLEQERPELLKNISVLPCYMGGHYFEFEFVPPNINTSDNLCFNTQGNMLTVGFDRFHCHFDAFNEGNVADEIKRALNLLDSIKSEEIVEVVYLEGERMIASSLKTIDELGKVEIESFSTWKSKCDNVKFISWFGTYDASKNV